MWVEDAVRTAVEDVGHEVSAVAGATGGSGRKLEAVWGRLVDLLALGPPPALRPCPHCGGEGMLAATRCSTCWSKLTPLAVAAAPQAAP